MPKQNPKSKGVNPKSRTACDAIFRLRIVFKQLLDPLRVRLVLKRVVCSIKMGRISYVLRGSAMVCRVLFALIAFFLMGAVQAHAQAVLVPDDAPAASEPNLGVSPRVSTPAQPVAPSSSPQSPSSSIENILKGSTVTSAPVMTEEEARKKAEQILNNPEFKKIRETKAFQDIMSGRKRMDQLAQEDKDELFDTAMESAKVKGPITITPGGKVAPGADMDPDEAKLRKAFGDKIPTSTRPATPLENYFRQIGQKMHDERNPKKDALFLDEIAQVSLDDSLFKSSLNVGVSPDYIWGVEDVRLIKGTLGYDAAAIPLNCQLRLDVQLETSDSTAPSFGIVFSGAQKAIRYNGSIKGAKATSRAICYPPKKMPQNGGIVTRSGDKYSILLTGRPACAYDAKKASSGYAAAGLLIQYVGDGTIRCAFQ